MHSSWSMKRATGSNRSLPDEGCGPRREQLHRTSPAPELLASEARSPIRLADMPDFHRRGTEHLSMANPLPFQQTPMGCRMHHLDHWEITAGRQSVGLQVSRPRAAPWLRIVRAPRFGRGLDPVTVQEIIRALTKLARDRAVLRLHVEVWSEKAEERASVAETCRTEGFLPASVPRSYVRTIWMDLRPSEEELLASFHATGRRHIRAPGKRGYEVRPIFDPSAAPVVEAILRDTFRRTGGAPPSVDWEKVVDTNPNPHARHRLVGLFPAEAPDGSSPVSFALGLLHGEVAEYAHAGSIRSPDLRFPLLYAPTWELIRWAKSRGASYWDFGGITEAAGRNEEHLAGIDDFKRYFATSEATVGGEWCLTPRPWAARFVQTVSRIAGVWRCRSRWSPYH